MPWQDDPRDAAIEDFGRLLAVPDELVALDEAALAIARCARPDLDPVGESVRLDELAAMVESPTLGGVVSTLFGTIGFRGDAVTYGDPANSFLDRVLDRRVGIPITLSVLTIEVARRVGVELHGVGLPGHFLVGAGDDVFIDAFAGGTLLDEAGVRALFARVSGGRLQWDPSWTAPVGHRAIVVRMLNNLKASYRRTNDLVGLRWVMSCRARVSDELALEEAVEFRRLMAPIN